MSEIFTFVDSTPGQQPTDGKPGQRPKGGDLSALIVAVEKLRKAAFDRKVEVLSVSRKRRANESLPTDVITYSNFEQTSRSVSRALFDISHYVGTYTTSIYHCGVIRNITIEIQPRWGKNILRYLLQHATGIYLLPDSASGIETESSLSEWMLALVWRNALNQTLRRFHIPREYKSVRSNDRIFAGRLDVPRQIRENFADQSKFCCVKSPLTIDTTINQTIRFVLKLLRKKPIGAALTSTFSAYDEKLSAFGVRERDIRPQEIDNIKYTPLSKGYRPLMQIGKAIIRHYGASNADVGSWGNAFFVDVAELWEDYLDSILTNNLPERYRVINPNWTSGQFLLSEEGREIRPDLIIENEAGVPVAIIDAKFKAYTKVGRYEQEGGGVSREDLYQMVTYLYHYGRVNTRTLGLFISPVEGSEWPTELNIVNRRPDHRIGVLNFDLSQWSTNERFDIEAIKTYERQFSRETQEILERYT